MSAEKIIDKALDGAGGLFESLYTHFVLRDLFGKIAPGAVVLTGLGFSAKTFTQRVLPDDLGAAVWIVLVALAWLTGLGLQGFGELTPLFSRVPSDMKEWRRGKPALTALTALEAWEYLRVRFRDVASPVHKHDFERLVVVKEAAGNGCLSIAVAVIIGFIHCLLRDKWALMLHLLLPGLVAIGLYVMHRRTFGQARDFMYQTVDYKGADFSKTS